MLEGSPLLMTQCIQPNRLFACLIHEENVENFNDHESEPEGIFSSRSVTIVHELSNFGSRF